MKIWEVIERLADDGDAVFENEDGKKIFLGKNGNVEQRAAWENTANPLVINVETILLSDWTRVPQSVPFHAKIYDCQQAYQEAAQLRSQAKTMTELVFILDRLLAILGRILGR